MWFATKREPNPAALYLFVLCAVPLLAATISGFGIVQQLFQLSSPRLLSLFVLLPTYAMLVRTNHSKRSSSEVDWLIIGYLSLSLILQLYVGDTFTNTLRYGLYAFLDAFVPYFVMSRYVIPICIKSINNMAMTSRSTRSWPELQAARSI
jgi:hypothetical protein